MTTQEPNSPEPGGEVIEARLLYLNRNSDGTMCSHIDATIKRNDGSIEHRELELPVSLTSRAFANKHHEGTTRQA